jgi:hypothetical protein
MEQADPGFVPGPFVPSIASHSIGGALSAFNGELLGFYLLLAKYRGRFLSPGEFEMRSRRPETGSSRLSHQADPKRPLLGRAEDDRILEGTV